MLGLSNEGGESLLDSKALAITFGVAPTKRVNGFFLVWVHQLKLESRWSPSYLTVMVQGNDRGRFAVCK